MLFRSDGAIQLKLRLTDERLHIVVRDNGVPVSSETIRKVDERVEQIRGKLLYGTVPEESKQTVVLSYLVKEGDGNHHFIGIENVFSRLLLNFGSCDFQMYANNFNGTTVEFMVPLNARVFKEVGE